MRRRLLLLSLALATLLGGRTASADDSNGWWNILADFFEGPARTESFEWRGKVAPGKTLEVKGINGSVTFERGSALEVRAVKSGRRNSPSEVKIEAVEHEGGVTLCSVYPSREDQPNECRPGSGGRMNVRNNDVSVAFTVTLPEGVRAVGRTVNGSVTATGLSADAEAYTVNGGVRLETDGLARAQTVNGSIRARMGSPREATPVSFKTVNGSVHLEVPSNINARLKAQTVNGSVQSSLSLNDATIGRRRLVGTLGTGGPDLVIETVNGSVQLNGR
jgi:hypothetical protein